MSLLQQDTGEVEDGMGWEGRLWVLEEDEGDCGEAYEGKGEWAFGC